MLCPGPRCGACSPFFLSPTWSQGRATHSEAAGPAAHRPPATHRSSLKSRRRPPLTPCPVTGSWAGAGGTEQRGPLSYSTALHGEVAEHPAAAILASRPHCVVSWSPFASGPKAAAIGLRNPFGGSRRGHRSPCLISGCLGAIWDSVAPRVEREEREPHREATTARTPGHAPPKL
ncbi:hypothetical protein NDU88_011578 [Pleurodeles waltl]|uniref:Uncharacterized protein n=1 Tax=Pleurodeles waltl TaxID=8319 RepID=A0AAV7S4P0_PLEWA|nr:hypothetical protein NDU88_011578 [Pleurodeles waltl]